MALKIKKGKEDFVTTLTKTSAAEQEAQDFADTVAQDFIDATVISSEFKDHNDGTVTGTFYNKMPVTGSLHNNPKQVINVDYTALEQKIAGLTAKAFDGFAKAGVIMPGQGKTHSILGLLKEVNPENLLNVASINPYVLNYLSTINSSLAPFGVSCVYNVIDLGHDTHPLGPSLTAHFQIYLKEAGFGSKVKMWPVKVGKVIPNSNSYKNPQEAILETLIGLIVEALSTVHDSMLVYVNSTMKKLNDYNSQGPNEGMVSDAISKIPSMPASTPTFHGLELSEFPTSVLQAVAVPLSSVSSLAVPVKATSAGSVYHSFYLGKAINAGLRYLTEGGTLSLRIEPKGLAGKLPDDVTAVLNSFGFDVSSKGYSSTHYNQVTKTVAQITLASLVSMLGMCESIQPPIPVIDVFIGKGK